MLQKEQKSSTYNCMQKSKKTNKQKTKTKAEEPRNNNKSTCRP